jgi:hypothetical protein
VRRISLLNIQYLFVILQCRTFSQTVEF